MAWTGSAPNQTYQRTDGVRTGSAVNTQAKAALVNDTAALADARENDFATAINLLWLRNGGNQPTANLPMNDKKFTGMAAGSARTDSVRLGQVQDGALIYAEAAGSANAIELTTSPSCSAVEGMVIGFVAEADSTGAVTVDLNSEGALALEFAGAALWAGAIQNEQFHYIGYDGTQWQLLNPALPAGLTDIAGLARTDGNIIVGDGTNWVAESGATARTSLGLGTGDSPQFTAVNIGAASDTTLSRASAGDLQIETNVIYRAGGTDVPVADGGTGASDASGARTNLGLAIGSDVQAFDELLNEIAALSTDPGADSGLFFDDSAGAMGYWTPTGALSFSGTNLAVATAADGNVGVIEIATQAEMETATDTGRAVVPGRQQHHPAHPKAWVNFDQESTHDINQDYGVTSLSDNAAGATTITFDTAFNGTSYGWMGSARALSAGGSPYLFVSRPNAGTKTTTTLRVHCDNSDGTGYDSPEVTVAAFGDQ